MIAAWTNLSDSTKMNAMLCVAIVLIAFGVAKLIERIARS